MDVRMGELGGGINGDSSNTFPIPESVDTCPIPSIMIQITSKLLYQLDISNMHNYASGIGEIRRQ